MDFESGYKKLNVYIKADDLVLLVYKLTKKFPKDELFGLISQMRRCAISVAANIVEGSSRQHRKDYLNFLYISKGSLAETEYLLTVAKRLNHISDVRYQMIWPLAQEAARTLTGLIQSVSQEVISDSESELYSFTSRVSGLESRV